MEEISRLSSFSGHSAIQKIMINIIMERMIYCLCQ